MRLRLVQEVDFRTNEQNNYEAIQKKNQVQLGPNDVICLFSKSKNQVLFVWRPTEIDFAQYGKREGKATVFRSQRLRISHRQWEPLMLQNYANELGIELEGLRRFEEIVTLPKKAA